MIKKSLFAEELAASMQRELQPLEKKAAMVDLPKAVDYLHSALEIFEDAGMTAKAEQILKILEKIAGPAGHTRVREMPSLQKLLESGVQMSDLKSLENDAWARARVSTAFRRLGYTDREIASFIGPNNVMSEEDAASLLAENSPYTEFMSWTKDPFQIARPEEAVDSKPAPKELSFDSLLKNPAPSATPEDLVFKSIAQELGLADDNDANGKPRKPKNPTSISDRHTKGLTSEKMVANLKGHGTVFNLADDGAADDLLDLDINEAAIEVFEGGQQDKTFEDEDTE